MRLLLSHQRLLVVISSPHRLKFLRTLNRSDYNDRPTPRFFMDNVKLFLKFAAGAFCMGKAKGTEMKLDLMTETDDGL